ncbi:hypothetical protein SPSYN_02848 [Sporotomaculum syntrophicum]|uniref:Uncharacterized protein n=1 Tax=Sporotomaculum syntrophicum TaxID=182264 RepID=A0A9D3AX26_9FIRM|nr:hypothetical protein [Sporotomaculum syntrophicum]KAF1083936.1 hypothetical protein SPSYN_02848 [Sporotomaculum syntrophicum]
MSIKTMVNTDICLCTVILETHNIKGAKNTIKNLSSAYESYIPGIKSGLCTLSGHHNKPENYLKDIAIIKTALKLFKANGCERISINKTKQNLILVNNKKVNTNTETVYMSVDQILKIFKIMKV